MPDLINEFRLADNMGSKTELLEKVIPNLRDLSVSSCNSNIKSGLLFRGARVFSRSPEDVEEILIKKLRVWTVIDLRDDVLESIPEEYTARDIISRFYKPHYITMTIKNLLSTASYYGDAPMLPKPHSRETSFTVPGVPSTSDLLQPPTSAMTTSSSTISTSQTKRSASRLPMDILRQKLPYMDRDIATSLLCSLAGVPLHNLVTDSRPVLAVINVLDSPEARSRIVQTAMKSPYLPILGLAKAADKFRLTTGALAPFYFCKYIVASQDIVASYTEMLETCGKNFALALKVIALSPGPVLFHCSLGKDRTGIVAMLLLSALGASESAIMFDYSLTEHASQHFQLYNRKFIVEYSGLTEHFCSARPETMKASINHLKDKYGSVEGYLKSIGFGIPWIKLLRKRYLHVP